MIATKVTSEDLALIVSEVLLNFCNSTFHTCHKNYNKNVLLSNNKKNIEVQHQLHTWILFANVEAKTKSKQNVVTLELSSYVTSDSAKQNQLHPR